MSTKEDHQSEESAFDIYIRFNGDDERDYCFQVHKDTTFGELSEIFKVLPLNLSPSIFYERLPIAFQLSNAPGVLTREGGLLFDDSADKASNLKLMKSTDVISEKAWPGQLVIPMFPQRTFLKYSVISALLVWLYTDLPDFISPTPGHSLMTATIKATSYILTNYLDMAKQAQALEANALAEMPKIAQVIFFLFNILKVLVIYFILWVGGFNPYAFHGKAPTINRSDLLKIGWTSAKKASRFAFERDYKKAKVDEVGGFLEAAKSGLLQKIGQSYVLLGPGEGFATPLNEKSPEDDEKFHLSYDYLRQQEAAFQKKYSKASDADFAAEYKKFRRYGPFDAPETLAEKAQRRIKLGSGDVTKRISEERRRQKEKELEE